MRIKLYTDNRADKDGRKPVRVSVSLLGRRHVTSLGCAMSGEEFEALTSCYYGGTPKTKVRHPRHNELIRMLHTLSDKLEWEAEKVSRGELTPASIDIAGIVNDCKGKTRKPLKDPSIIAPQLMLKFIAEERKVKDLHQATVNQMCGLQRDLNKVYPNLTIETAATKAWLQEFIELMVKRGYNSNTVRSKYRYLHWFLKWSFQNGYCDNDFDRFKFELRVANPQERVVMFLTFDEIMAIRAYKPDPGSVLCRDVFLFQCFTGLRYSDAINLKNTDIKDGVLTIIVHKTGKLLHNRLNKYALEIAKKYHNKFGDNLFPYVSDGTINVHIRRICKALKMNDHVTKWEYRNHQRIEVVMPKWQMVTTHVGRKSFIVNSLDFDLTPTQVIGYTGHSSIMAMHPYVSISQKKKDAAMDVWNKAEAAPSSKNEINKLKAQIKELEKRLESLTPKDGENG